MRVSTFIQHRSPECSLAAKSPAEPIWQAILELAKSLSVATLAPLSNFWRLSKFFIDGKFMKVGFT